MISLSYSWSWSWSWFVRMRVILTRSNTLFLFVVVRDGMMGGKHEPWCVIVFLFMKIFFSEDCNCIHGLPMQDKLLDLSRHSKYLLPH